MHASLSRIKDIALGTILGNFGVAGIEDAARGVIDLGKGMIETNAQIELMRQRLNILYQSTAEGAQAFAFLKQNELTKPFDIESIMQASVQLVAFKQDITTVLPALEDVAGAMGQSLPKAAQAFTDAMAGRFAMMKRDLGISKEELVAFGLQMNKSGHVTDPSSFVSSFLALAQSNQFKGGADKMAQTWTGLMSSMSSQWTYFQANLGQGAFGILEKQLSGVVHMLQNPGNSAAIQRVETQIGAGLAQMTVEAINFGKAIGPYVGSAIAFIARAWPLVERGAGAAFGFVGTVVSGFANWLQSTGFPAIVKVLNALTTAWEDIAPPVVQVLQAIGNAASSAFGAIAADAGPLMQGLAGAFKVGLGAMQIVFGGGLDLLSGNWAKFQNDFNAGGNLIMTGAVQLFGGVVQAMVPLAAKLFDPWTKLAIGVRQIVQAIGGFVAIMAEGVVSAVMHMEGPIVRSVNKIIDAYNAAAGVLHLQKMQDFIDPTAARFNAPGAGRAGPVGQAQTLGDQLSQQAGQAIRDWFNKNAPGIDPWQKISAGKTDKQAQADIGARVDQILAEYGLGTGTTGKKYSVSAPVGQQILDQIKGLFKGLGAGFTMPDLLKSLGFQWNGTNITGYTPPAGGLPVSGVGSAAGAGGAGGASSASYTFPAIAQNLGQLAASFGGTRVTPGGGGGEQEKARQLERTNADLHHTVASLQAQLSQRNTEENLLRQQLREFELARGGIQELVQRTLPKPQPASPVSLRPALVIR